MIRPGGPLDTLHFTERLLPNGRIVEARNVPFEGGRVVRTYTDITERKYAEDRIQYVAQHDELTGLANRSAFHDRLRLAIEPPDHRGHGFALLCLDLDRFKIVNDTRGHQFGDRLLAEAARRMRRIICDVDVVARMGGDEFAIIQLLGDKAEAASALAQRLVEAVSLPYDIDGQRSIIGVSIGVALYPLHGEAPDVLMRNADTALYRAKEDGRNTFCCFEAAMDMRLRERSLIEHDLRAAIADGQFELAYQPVYHVASGELRTFEALLRWNHPNRGSIPPDHFIPIAEMSGLIVPIGLWVIETACAEASVWNRLNRPCENAALRVAVNLSPLQFREPDLPERIAEILERTNLKGTQLDLEVTEGLLLDDSEQVMQTIAALRRQGIRITLDDFGKAYASLSYLCRFPFDRIKIDRCFIRSIDEDRQAQAVVEAILMLSRNLKLEVVAEGVETLAQLDVLRRLQCGHVQGFLTGRPLPSANARALLCNALRPGIDHLVAHG
jgi:diguanylate cyclase (GGDEF)-like protein